MDNEKVYYIIREDVLPEAVKKTIIMKKALEENPKLSIQEIQRQSILSLSIDVDDIPGILGRVLSVVNEEKCSVLTIHQTVPINSRATIIISLEIDPGHTNIEKLTKRIQNLEFVNRIKVIGVSM